jgi:hypothetical protein
LPAFFHDFGSFRDIAAGKRFRVEKYCVKSVATYHSGAAGSARIFLAAIPYRFVGHLRILRIAMDDRSHDRPVAP